VFLGLVLIDKCRQKADTVARKIAADLRLTRRLAVSSAAVNVSGYTFNMTGTSPYREYDGYALHMEGTPYYSGYNIVNLADKEVVDSYSINSDIICTGGANFKFGPLGNLLAGSSTQLVVSSERKTYTITIEYDGNDKLVSVNTVQGHIEKEKQKRVDKIEDANTEAETPKSNFGTE